jgi:hypothetical protein
MSKQTEQTMFRIDTGLGGSSKPRSQHPLAPTEERTKLVMEARCSLDMVVDFHQVTQCYIPQERTSQVLFVPC